MFIGHSLFFDQRLCCVHAQASSSLLRCRLSSFHHYQLFSPQTLARQQAAARPVANNPGAGRAAVRFCGRRLCGDAGTYSPAGQRAGPRHAVDGHASLENRGQPEVTPVWFVDNLGEFRPFPFCPSFLYLSDLGSGCSGRSSQVSVECRQRQPQSHRKSEIGGVVIG